MNKSLNELSVLTMPEVFSSPGLMNVLEDHIEHLKSRVDSINILVEGHIGAKYRFDLYGLLNHYGVPHSLMWITMRINGLRSPQNYTGQIGYVLIPPQSEIDKIVQTYNTQTKKIQQVS